MSELTETELEVRLRLVQEVMGDIDYLIIAKKRNEGGCRTLAGCSAMTPDEKLGLAKLIQIELELEVREVIVNRKEVKGDAEWKEVEENG